MRVLCFSRKPMRKTPVSGFPRALLSLTVMRKRALESRLDSIAATRARAVATKTKKKGKSKTTTKIKQNIVSRSSPSFAYARPVNIPVSLLRPVIGSNFEIE